MTQTPRERLNALLPAIYRMRDFAQGEPLRALLRVLEEELVVVEEDVARLYDSWFVETCDEWLLPYIGDLVGARLLHGVSQRAATANTLAYRRRKGSLQTLAALARDVSGWPARAVEYLPRVAAAQHLSCPRPSGAVTADLRRADTLLRIGTPFEETTHNVDIRTRGRYSTGQVGLYVWRLAVHRLEGVSAVAAAPGCFYVSPLGHETALWSPAHSRPGLDATMELRLAPQPLSRRELYYVLEARRQAHVDGRTVLDPYFSGEPVLSLTVEDEDGVHTIPPEQIVVSDLRDWEVPPARLVYRRHGDDTPHELPIAVALDPERGRLSFPAGSSPRRVWASYHYGLAGEIGGGYERTTASPSAAATGTAAAVSWTVRDGDSERVLARLGDPGADDSLWRDGAEVVVQLADSASYRTGSISIPDGGRLVLRAANGQRPLLRPPAPPAGATGAALEPHFAVTIGAGATLVLDGVLLCGGLRVEGPPSGSVAGIELRHSTLVPGLALRPDGSPEFPAAASVHSVGPGVLTLTLDFSITGRIDLRAGGSQLTARDSIIDGAGGAGAALRADTAALQRVTVLGSTTVSALQDTVDTLFKGPVSAPEGPDSGISCCYLIPTAPDQVPRLDRCQPAMALAEAIDEPRRILAELRPWFVSERYGTASYAQLATRCHPSIRLGASDEGEIGALHHQHMAQREANLLDSQAEYLRFGLTLNLFLVT